MPAKPKIQPRPWAARLFCFQSKLAAQPLKRDKPASARDHMLDVITKVEKIPKVFDFEAKADSKNRHRRARHRRPWNIQKPILNDITK
jgi:hypothetical protein